MDNDIRVLSEDFGVRIIKAYQFLSKKHREQDLFRQLLRSGTSIGANVAEAEAAISKKEFLSKMYISLKEAAETMYWLRLLYRTNYLEKEQYDSLFKDCSSIHNILTSITKTTIENMKEKTD